MSQCANSSIWHYTALTWTQLCLFLTTAALLSTPGQAVHHGSQKSVLQGDKTISLIREVMDHILCFAPEQHLKKTPKQTVHIIYSAWHAWIIRRSLCDERCLLCCKQVWSGPRQWKGRRLPWELDKGPVLHRLVQMHAIAFDSRIWKRNDSAA